ncbi:hypothetical protein ABH920_001700 [Catenulispora sp. EB89]|uniref:NPCBM/NEW2 domain-containing protein n=1 Tax=Catenulispora sp. EB89 TaxID=3156257 RepID=UPI0035141705
MTERNLTPGTGWANPAGPGPNRPDDAGGALNQVKNAWRTPGGKLLTIAPAVIALIVGIVLGMSVGGGTKTVHTATAGPTSFITTTATTTAAGAAPSSATSATSSGSVVVPQATAPGTPTGTTPPSATDSSPSPNSTGVGVVPLADLTPAGGAWESHNANPMINGTLQQFSVMQDIGEYNTDGDVGYNLGRYYTKFTGLLGLDDNSAKSTMHPTVEIDGDGVKIATFTPTLGHPAQINLNVSGVLRLDIKYTSLDNTGYNTIGTTLILGNGQLTTVPGYHPPPPTSS